MIAAFVEAVTDLALPCSLTLLVPGVAASLSTRSHSLAVAMSTYEAATIVGWLRLTEQIPARLGTWVSLAVGVLVLISFGSLFASSTRTGQRVTAGAVIGVAAASIWTPCVGEELGTILNRGPDDPLGVLLPFAAFVGGISLVSIAVALARVVFQLPERLSRALSVVATSVGAAFALLLASGLYTDVVAQLVFWSL